MNTDQQPDAVPKSAQASPPGETPESGAVQVPDHQLLRRIGKGSYGEVWLARSVMGIYRAVKIVHRSAFDHVRPFERELDGIQKFEPISRSHDGFVDILHVGRQAEGEYYYYIMEVGDDQNTGQTINPDTYQPKTLASLRDRQGRLTIEECLTVGSCLADGLECLHSNGLSHRDVKPANIIFVNNRAKLADIGLVTGIGQGNSYVGTEGFIPPEGPGTPQADIFGLGMVLYEISTGMDRSLFPSLPSDIESFLDKAAFAEFNEIILRACQRDLKQRYSSAKHLLSDLQVLQNGQSIRRLRLLEKRWQKLQRAAVIGSLLVALGAILVYPIVARNNLARDMRERQIGAKVNAGIGALNQGNMIEALAHFSQALMLTPKGDPSEADQRLRCATALAYCPKLTHLDCFTNRLVKVEFSADGRYLLTTPRYGGARLWSFDQEAYTRPTFCADMELQMTSLSPDGKWILAAGVSNTCLLDADTGRVLHNLPQPEKVNCARFSPDGQRVATAGEGPIIRIWDAHTGLLLTNWTAHQGYILCLNFSADGKWIVSSSQDGTARIWNAGTGASVGVAMNHPSWVYTAAFSPNHQNVVTACFDRKARVWEVSTGRFLGPELRHGDGVTSAEYSPDGQLILTASLDGAVRLWDAQTQLPSAMNSVLKHSGRVMHATFDPEGRRIASACNEGSVRVWDWAANGMPSQSINTTLNWEGTRSIIASNQWLVLKNYYPPSEALIPTGNSLHKAEFGPGGRWLTTVIVNLQSKPELAIWDASTGKQATDPIALAFLPTVLALSPKADYVCICSNNFLQVISASAPYRALFSLSVSNSIDGIVFSPDGKQLMIQSAKSLWLRDAANGALIAGPIEHPAIISHSEYSPDGRQFVTCCADRTLKSHWARVWNTQTGLPVSPTLNHRDGVLYASFSPDGSRVVTASEDFSARVWDAATGRPLTPEMRHEDQVQTALFSADGRRIITASMDKTARIWSARTGEPLTPLYRHSIFLQHARLLKDSRKLLTGLEANRSWIWMLPEDQHPASDFSDLSSLLYCQLPDQNALEQQATLAYSRLILQPWNTLKEKYPGDFRLTQEELNAWNSSHLPTAEQGQSGK